MGREHFWPIWLINYAQVTRNGVRWVNGPNVNPRGTTLPLCNNCNHRLGAELEEPMSRLLPRIEAGEGLSDSDAEIFVRWLWKFEGLTWAYWKLDEPNWRYSDRWTLIERVLDIPLGPLRSRLTLAIGLAHRNDDGFADWPMGLDSKLTDHDAIFMSGVFKNIAVMVSRSEFADQIPGCYSTYELLAERPAEAVPVFFPATCFPYCRDAVAVTIKASKILKDQHEEQAVADLRAQRIVAARPRLIIPN